MVSRLYIYATHNIVTQIHAAVNGTIPYADRKLPYHCFVQLYLIIFLADPQPELVGCTRANRYHNFTCSIHLCYRKQSSADLQSRLKSRKILGVGATDDGLDIHRSKVGYNYCTYE